MNRFKLPKRMGAEQLMELETAKFNSNLHQCDNVSKSKLTKHILLASVIILSFGIGYIISKEENKDN